jgi:hypothetical protein
MTHEERAREALSVRTLTPTQMEDCIPSVAAALQQVERETAAKCAEIAKNGRCSNGCGHDHCTGRKKVEAEICRAFPEVKSA